MNHKLTNEVVDRIAYHDPRYAGHTPEGAIVIRDPETGVETVMSHGDYILLAEPHTDEVLFCTIDSRVDAAEARLTVDSTTVILWLDEIRRLAADLCRENQQTNAQLLRLLFPSDGEG